MAGGRFLKYYNHVSTANCSSLGLASLNQIRAAYELDTRCCCFHQAAICREIVERHAARGEARLELLSDCIAVQVGKSADGGDRAGLVFDDEAGQALIDDLGDGATVIGNDRGTACHRLDHDEAKRLRPVDGNEQPDRAAE